MLKKAGEPTPPSGLTLKLFRLPIYLYRCKLGFLLGQRFILLQHWGRVSGQLRETVIEVIDQDRASEKLYCASGFGEKSQWFRNIAANNAVLITLKNRRFDATARILPPKEAEAILLRYAQAHPRAMIGVARLSGYDMDGSEADVIEFSAIVKIIEFRASPEAQAES